MSGHDDGCTCDVCHIEWAEHLREVPDTPLRRNPFLALLKEGSDVVVTDTPEDAE